MLDSTLNQHHKTMNWRNTFFHWLIVCAFWTVLDCAFWTAFPINPCKSHGPDHEHLFPVVFDYAPYLRSFMLGFLCLAAIYVCPGLSIPQCSLFILLFRLKFVVVCFTCFLSSVLELFCIYIHLSYMTNSISDSYNMGCAMVWYTFKEHGWTVGTYLFCPRMLL